MTNLRTAAQQALEALEYHVEQTRPIWKTSEAIAALEAALAQAEPAQRNHYRNLWPERNFCSRCGKRLADEGIHTCTPPQQAEPTRSQRLADVGFTRRPSLWALQARQALELIAAPQRPDGTWNRDRAACRQIAAEALGRYDDE